MMLKYLILLVVIILQLEALTFGEAIEKLQSHESVDALYYQSKAQYQDARKKSSWGDPMLKIAAKNFPIQSWDDDQTPMTGLDVVLSQKVPITSKYSVLGNALKAVAKATEYKAKDRKALLAKSLWEIVILKRKIIQEVAILKDNLKWIEKILDVSEQLYATGKSTQQAILELQIRKSEIESDISNRTFEHSEIENRFEYLFGTNSIEEGSIPWKILELTSSQIEDVKELMLKETLEAKTFSLNAAKLNRIPDPTLSLGYTKRSNIDGVGDFITASISFPLPVSSEKHANYAMALQEKLQASKTFEAYKNSKRRDIAVTTKEITKIEKQLDILNNKTKKYAINSRTITSKSYSFGDASYIELLQSELKLQSILLQEVSLKAAIYNKKVTLKYIKGEALHE